jgi:hypothetical protein
VFDTPEREALHRAVERECGNRFDLWAAKHGLTWSEVFRAAWYGGDISDGIRRALGSTD